MTIKCKRIIEGKTYNTETATQIAGWTDDHGSHEDGNYLYQTRFGAFFRYSFLERMEEDDYENIEPFTAEEARRWLEINYSHSPEVIERLFGEMPEAGSGEIKYTLRLPESLRDRLAALAKNNGQSLNAWMVRCLEACAAQPKPEAS